MMPHCPFFAPEELFDYYFDKVDVPMPTAEEVGAAAAGRQGHEEAPAHRRAADGTPDTGGPRGVLRHVRALRRLGRQDSGQTRRDRPRSKDTLVVYTTDHGEAAGEHGMWWKSSYYEESVGVPLIARLPGVVLRRVRAIQSSATPSTSRRRSSRRRERVQLPGIAGRSLWTELRGQSDETRSSMRPSASCTV